MPTGVNGADYLPRYGSLIHKHRITTTTRKKVGIDETGTNVGKTYIQTTHIRQLLKSLNVCVLIRLRRTVRRCYAQSLCACD